MLSLSVSHKGDRPLAEQIVAGIKRQIDDRHLRPGTKLPSIRDFAEAHRVSRFTVVEAYDRLVAMGWAPADEVEQVLNAHLANRKYFLGEEFSALDILIGGGLNFMMMAKMIAETPTLKAYTARITDRPAFGKMMSEAAPR